VHGVSEGAASDLADLPHDDLVLPFQIKAASLRGRIVRLGPAVDLIISRHAYPPVVAHALAEICALAAALAGTLKYDGVFTVQIKGDGPVRIMMADVTNAGALRAYAQFNSGVDALGPGVSVPRLFGGGYLAFTVDQGDKAERYQGIVELSGATLAECAHNYFRESDQFQAGIKLSAGRTGHGDTAGWRAGAVMIQRLPPEDAQGSAEGRDLDHSLMLGAEQAEEDWRRAMILMSSASAAELVDRDLPAWRLVDRLFGAEGVAIYRPVPLRHACRCSRGRVAAILRAIPREELETLKEDGVVVVTCEFCNTGYRFDDAALAVL
jgi:molecular chaperone Hsp33